MRPTHARHAFPALLATLALALTACSPPPRADDGGLSCDAGPTIQCRTGVAGSACTNETVAPTCLDGIWACPPGSTDPSMCACTGDPSNGCPDAAGVD